MSVNNPRTSTHPLHNFAQFIGSYLALLVGCLEDGENVTPLLSIQKVDESWFEWFGNSSYEHAANKAREKFNTIPHPLVIMRLLALMAIIQMVINVMRHFYECLSPEGGKAYKLIIPHRSANSAEGLAIYQTKLFFPSNSLDIDKSLFLDNLWSGFCHHKQAFEFWNKHRDHHLEPILIGDY